MLVKFVLFKFMLFKFMPVKFMDLNPLFANREIGQAGIDPSARVVVVNPILFDVDSFMSVAAEDAIGIVLARILQGSSRDF